MKRVLAAAALAGVLALGGASGYVAAQAKKEALWVDSAKANYVTRPEAPGAAIAVVWGDPDKGANGQFTKFTPGTSHPLHYHTSELRIVVLKGAYVFKPEKGEEKRVTAGQFLMVPAGERHVSGGDAKDGALFYLEAAGKFDINFVK